MCNAYLDDKCKIKKQSLRTILFFFFSLKYEEAMVLTFFRYASQLQACLISYCSKTVLSVSVLYWKQGLITGTLHNVAVQRLEWLIEPCY